MIIYRDDGEATEAYLKALPIYIPQKYADRYGHPAGLQAPPHADESALYCNPVTINGKPAQACGRRSLWRHVHCHIRAGI
jgi:hypothetical protein